MGVPRERRLRRRADFAHVAAEGKGRSNALVTLRFVPNALAVTRCGFSVSKRLGHAVQRNRAKRLLREAARTLDPRPGYDLILIARPEMAGSSYAQAREAVADVFHRAGLLAQNKAGAALQGSISAGGVA